jgi:hypothetical protein
VLERTKKKTEPKTGKGISAENAAVKNRAKNHCKLETIVAQVLFAILAHLFQDSLLLVWTLSSLPSTLTRQNFFCVVKKIAGILTKNVEPCVWAAEVS